MQNRKFYIALAAAAALSSSAAFGQADIEIRARQLPGWDLRAREGRCEVRVWVDSRAEVRMRGDNISMRTTEGSSGRDEGSTCSQPLPYNSVGGFAIRQTAGRGRVTLAQAPTRMNNYTVMVAIDDRQVGGDDYAFEVTWRAAVDVVAATAPFFDDVRACQDLVRQRFLRQNGSGAYLDFQGFADRQGQEPDRAEGRGRARFQGRGRAHETIQGRGSGRNRNESRALTYSCAIDVRQNQVLSGSYQFSSKAQGTDGRSRDRRELR
jgi:hypothetical protein